MTLEIENLNKSFGSLRVLDKLSVSVNDVHSLAVIGPSGGGKSTLLRIVAGLLLADSGMLKLNGKSIPEDEEELRRYRARLGVVFQAYNLFPHLSAFENVTLPLTKVHGYVKGEAEARAEELLRRFKLFEHSHKRPAQLSGGQQQRTAIARAVAVRPDVLMLDEPTSALDPALTSEVLDMIEELRAEGMDMLLVTHHLGFAIKSCEMTMFVSGGIAEECGPSEKLFNSPESPALKDFLSRVLKYE